MDGAAIIWYWDETTRRYIRVDKTHPLPVDISPGVKTATTILNLASIAAGATSTLANCTAVDLSGGPATLALTVEATYNAAATQGIRIHVRTSTDNVNYDTEDWDVWTPGFATGTSIRQTKHYDTSPMYVKVLVENLDPAQTVTAVKIISTRGV